MSQSENFKFQSINFKVIVNIEYSMFKLLSYFEIRNLKLEITSGGGW